MTVLYDVTGRFLPLDGDSWSEALRVARDHGWSPRRTIEPAAPLGARPRELWNGAHEPAIGQQVTREDAAQLSGALARAEGPEWMARLAEFAARSGFLVCVETESMTDSMAGLARHLLTDKLDQSDTIWGRADSRGSGSVGAESPAGASGAGGRRR